jgi:hypothetical protein
MCDALVVAGIGIALDHATPSSDGFCVVREITRGGPVDISGYERSNGEVRRVQVGDWLLRVNDISCQDMPRDQIKRYIVGHLLFYINTCTPGTPITVEWNKELPCYDSTCDTQVLKAFTDLPKDLPFVYGSLTAARTSFRPWLGPKNTPAFHITGMEFLQIFLYGIYA